MQLRSILHPIDFSDFSTAAYEYGLSLAQHDGSRLAAFQVVGLWKYPLTDYAAREVGRKFSPAPNEDGEVCLREFVEKHSAAGVQPEVVAHHGDASNCILSFAQKGHMEGIAMGTHGRRGFDRLVLGSTTDRVMRKATCSVLVASVPFHQALGTGPNGRHRLKRIRCRTDFSNDSEQARGYAISLAAECGAELTLLHVAKKVAARRGRRQSPPSVHKNPLNWFQETKRNELLVRAAVGFGTPYERMVRYATETQPSLIIVTARRGDAVDRAVFDWTTYRVVPLGPLPGARGQHVINRERRVGFHGQHHHH